MNIITYITLMSSYFMNKSIIPRLHLVKNNINSISNRNKINNINKQNLNSISDYYDVNNNIKNKKLISISPGGFKGFYLLGTLSFIKDNYDLSNYIFSGASAGAWCSLIMSMKPKFDFFEFIDKHITDTNSIFEIEQKIKRKLLYTYKESDFDLKQVFIGVTRIHNFKMETTIYSDFVNLEDAIDCCIASSHVPFVTGGFLNKYHNMLTFDGGFSSYPYVREIEPVIHVHPNLWKKNINQQKKVFFYDTSLFSKENYDFTALYMDGYNDAKKNKDYLQQVFDKK